MAYDKPRVGYWRAVIWLLHTVFFPILLGWQLKKDGENSE